ncbi:MAG: aminotransferase class V-fold PLP-dependent enzyme [Planctomycetota bacterium]|nr:aminotransferase class V-fold PLP-dependent enzyme [Planctomycetota bacterium]
MKSPSRIYLDNAATSWPKPERVYQAVDGYQRSNGCTLGRTTGQLSGDLSRSVEQLRSRLRQLLGAPRAAVLFTMNGSDSLNLAIHGLVRPGDHVLTTTAEHNSVLRPLRTLEDRGMIEVTRLECDSLGRVEAARVDRAVRPDTRLVCITHCSNVTGAKNDLCSIGERLKSRQALLLVDAAQSVGSAEIAMEDWGIDLMACPGHKGLLGPLGTGVLMVGQRAETELQPVRQGGTGASSESDQHPQGFPEAFEVGNHNMPGLIGLREGVEHVMETGVQEIARTKRELARQFVESCREVPGIRFFSELETLDSGIVSFNVGIESHELATVLDSAFGIQIRAGYHCASLIHPYIGSSGGCARMSFGCLNTMDEAGAAADAIRNIVESFS